MRYLPLIALTVTTFLIAGLVTQAAQEGAEPAAAAPRLDVLFVIDTTGSMSDEIQVVKDKVRDMVAKIASGKPTPEARFGLVLYRDRGDQYVTQVTDLTYDIDDLVKAINAIEAGGGGDYPESMVEALHVAINKVSWDTKPTVEKTLFIIADAPPHLDYKDDFDYKQDVAKALDQGIIVHVIGCSGLAEADAQFLEKNLARAAEGTYNSLTYKRTYTDATGGTTTVLEAGDKTYAMRADAAARPGEAPTADWRKGAERLAAAGVAEAAPTTPAAPMPTAAPAGPMAGVGGGRLVGAPARAMTGGEGTAGARQVGATENNLDSILVGVVQRQAERRGVKYADTGMLEILARFEGTNAAEGLSGQRVIRDAKEWEALWKAVHAGVTPLPTTPAVDFDKNMVLAVFLGRKPTGGFAVHIQAAVAEEKGFRVDVWSKSPSPGGMVVQALTHPYSIVVVPKAEGEARWTKMEPPADK